MISWVRKWHGWFGVGAALFIFVTAATGMGLNHRDLIFGARPEGGKPRDTQQNAASAIDPDDVAALPISLDQAIRRASEHLRDDTTPTKVELTSDGDRLVYRVSGNADRLVQIDGTTGKATTRENARPRRESANGGSDWSRLVKDLHTGKLLGGPGKLLLDFIAISLMALTFSGTWLWSWPRLRERRRRRSVRSEVGA